MGKALRRYDVTMKGLTIGYPNRTVATDLNAQVAPGRLTCLIGSNGAGKSTLLRTLAGLQPPIKGKVLLRELCKDTDLNIKTDCERTDGKNVDKANHTDGKQVDETNRRNNRAGETADEVIDIARLDRRHMARLVAVVLTDRPDMRQLSVREVAAMGRMPYTGFFGRLNDEDRQVVDEALVRTGIGSYADRAVETLSDGERQKVMIAKALAQQTPVMILDEPTAFLDYPSKVEILKLLRRLAHDTGRTILLSTHDLDLAAALGDRFLTLDGQLHDTSVEELKDYIRLAADTETK
jgi:iron complex transport system ATP-binding protein